MPFIDTDRENIAFLSTCGWVCLVCGCGQEQEPFDFLISLYRHLETSHGIKLNEFTMEHTVLKRKAEPSPF